MYQSNAKAKRWLEHQGYQEIFMFPHTRFSKDLNFCGLKFDGMARNNTKIVLFQIKTNRKAPKRLVIDMELFGTMYGVNVLWINCPDYKEVEVYGYEA